MTLLIKLLFYFLIAYVLYKLVFRFILPIYYSTKQVRRQMHDMQERMRNQYREQQQQTPPPPPPKESTKPRDNGDYIDFEEVK